jgi:hypothetical protein
MLLVSAKIGPFKSIEEPKEVKIENDVTVLVWHERIWQDCIFGGVGKS